MILYHAVSTYQLIEVILFHMTQKQKEKADIIVSTDITSRFPNYIEMLKCYFSQVIVYNNSKATKIALEGIHSISEYFNSILKQSKTNIKQYSQIYVGCCHAAFAIYLSYNKIEFIFMEDAAGALSHIKGLEEHVLKDNQKRHDLLKKMGLYDGESKLILNRILNFSAQNKSFVYKKTDIDFDVEKALESLDINSRRELISKFTSCQNILVPEHACLLLTEHLANLRILSYHEQLIMYQLFVDYFLSEYSLIIKPHPDDIVPYKKYFPDCIIIKEKFPSEFLPFMFSNKPAIIATVSSTAIFGMRRSFENVIEFNQNFSYHLKQFYELNRYFAVLKWAGPLFANGAGCYVLGADYCVISNFLNFCSDLQSPININTIQSVDKLTELQGEQIVIVDLPISDYKKVEHFWETLNKVPDEVYIIFLNSNEKYIFFHHKYKYMWDNISPLELTVTANQYAQNAIYPSEKSYIYIYKKGERYRMESTKKELSHTGVDLSINEFTGNELRIKVLEGIIRSLEERLLYYVNEENDNTSN